MRVLLDACDPRGLRDALSGHHVRTAPEMGWGDLDNGNLFAAMAGHFDALLTVDKRLPHQQRVSERPFGIVVLRAKSSRLSDLLPLVPNVRLGLSIPPGGRGQGGGRLTRGCSGPRPVVTVVHRQKHGTRNQRGGR